MIFTPHSEKQEKALFSTKKITLCGTGIQWGKTFVGTMRTFLDYLEYPEDNYIVAAPSFPILIQAALPNYIKVFEGHGKMNEGKMIFNLHSGGKIFFRTATHPDSIVGITRVRHIHGDEAGKFTLYFWENLQGRSALLDCPITLTTSPYSLNWIYKELIKPTRDGKRNDVELISASSIENPYFSKKSYYDQKKTMDARRFRAQYDGSFERMQGLVYDCFNESTNILDQFSFNPTYKYFAGIDWGYTDPFCMLIGAITPSNELIIVDETYQASLNPKDIERIVKSKASQFKIQSIFCDPSQPAMIDLLCESGIPAIKGDNAIMAGVLKTYSLFKERKIYFLKGTCPNTLDEIDTYHYPEPKDYGPDQDHKPVKPVDADNHACDTLRYLVMGVKQFLEDKRYKETVPEDTAKLLPHQRIQRVQRRSRRQNTETWE